MSGLTRAEDSVYWLVTHILSACMLNAASMSHDHNFQDTKVMS